jgi:hypothetical protein
MGGIGLSIGFLAGMLLLGALTADFARRHFGLRLWSRDTAIAVVLAVLPALLAVPVARACDGWEAWRTLLVCAGFEAVVVSATAAAALRARHSVALYAATRWRDMRRERARNAPGDATVGHALAAKRPVPASPVEQEVAP